MQDNNTTNESQLTPDQAKASLGIATNLMEMMSGLNRSTQMEGMEKENMPQEGQNQPQNAPQGDKTPLSEEYSAMYEKPSENENMEEIKGDIEEIKLLVMQALEEDEDGKQEEPQSPITED